MSGQPVVVGKWLWCTMCYCSVVCVEWRQHTTFAVPSIRLDGCAQQMETIGGTQLAVFDFVVKVRRWPLAMLLVVRLFMTTLLQCMLQLHFDVRCCFSLDNDDWLYSSVTYHVLESPSPATNVAGSCRYVKWNCLQILKHAWSEIVIPTIWRVADGRLQKRNVFYRWFQ